jgi:hypothetical protein
MTKTTVNGGTDNVMTKTIVNGGTDNVKRSFWSLYCLFLH